MSAAAGLDRVVALEAAGDAAGARRLCATLVAERPDDFAAVHRMGLLAHAAGDLTEAARYLARAIQLRPDEAPVFADLARLLRDLGKPEDAARAEQKARALARAAADPAGAEPRPEPATPAAAAPDAIMDRLQAALAHHRAGRVAEAEALYAAVLTEAPDNADALYLSAVAQRARGRTEPALALVRRALAAQPLFPGAHNTHGNLLRDLGRLDEAAAAFRTAVEQQPDYAEAHASLGNVLVLLGRPDAAVPAFEAAIAHQTGLVEAHNGLAAALDKLGRLDEAEASYREAIRLEPSGPRAYSNLAGVLHKQGRPAEAAAACETALRLAPNYILAFKNLLLASVCRDDVTNADLAALHRRFGETLPRPGQAPRFANRRDPRRRLRIGYLTADLHGGHPVVQNFRPIFEAHDRNQFAIHIYALNTRHDPVTDWFQRAADGWRDVHHLSDAELAATIRGDEIDILVTLAGRFDSNRLSVCTHRAAPVQVSLFDVATSGIAEIDYLIADRHFVPRATTEYFSERVLRLPRYFVTEFPPDLPPLRDVPGRGGARFGCFNNPSKITPSVLQCWGRILAALPDATLELKYMGAYASEPLRIRIVSSLTMAGARAEQILFHHEAEPRDAFLDRHNRIDIALDTFPFCGSTTSLVALSMGVPVVTWRWDRMVSNWTTCMLRELGLERLIAPTAERYVAIALEAARDRDAMRAGRRALQARVRAAPMCDGRTWTPRLERLYRAIWRRHLDHAAAEDLAALLEHALAHHRASRIEEAHDAYAAIVARQPDHFDANHLLGVILRQRGDLAGAEHHIRRAITLRPDFAAAHNNLGNVLRDRGKLDEAVASFERATALAPSIADPFVNLADLLVARRRFDEAVTALRSALALRPDDARAWTLLGHAHQSAGQVAEELAAFREALRLQPERAASHFSVAHALERTGDTAGAEAEYRQAVALDPDNADLRNNLGALYLGQRRLEEARAAFEAAIARQPGHAPALSNLGTVLLKLGLQAEAGAICRQAVDSCLQRAGQERDRLLASSFKNLLLVSVCRDDLDNAALEALHREFGTLFGQADAPPATTRDPRPDRPLRVGYLTSDLKVGHPIVLNLRPILRAHDRSAFAVHVYASTPHQDAVSEEIRGLVDGWHPIAHLDDRAVATLIRDDAIDILVSVASRFDSNRPTVCSWRPAPIQISYGDVATSGLTAIDHIVADRRMIPPGTTEYFAERPLRLPKYYITEFPAELPPVSTAPRDGPPRFGCFNNPSKITPAVLRCWGRILAALPESRLALKYMDIYVSEGLRTRTLDALVAAGARPEQVEFSWTPEHRTTFVERYNDLDVALDTFPFCGSTTTTTALAMGVPVVTWPWDRFVSRWTEWMVEELGLAGLVARSADDYVALAVAAARDRDAWRRQRGGIREALRTAPMCDGAGWTRTLERFYRALWKAHLRRAA